MSIGHKYMSIRPLDEQKCPLDIQMSIRSVDEQKCPLDINIQWQSKEVNNVLGKCFEQDYNTVTLLYQ